MTKSGNKFLIFGIGNDQSVLEWNKHLSILGWRLDIDPDGKQQSYLLCSAECQHLVHEKAIREFKASIGAKLFAVHIELDTSKAHCWRHHFVETWRLATQVTGRGRRLHLAFASPEEYKDDEGCL
ncbi:hypothetical protein Psta_1304 [Pirellula staleyi DSM 6068]|uniref:Uncharacterized protein n=1 Tax=Pirellula staleyi (strain ATCC 27377 / DSM 6068 / ICPB 4128) TaxID=530564 RepID=D2QWA6_PIRSD|nr:hypothetical protein [Pirellula staleyi]ADB15981.1 hypothetical protein Psta_1304 [Pirellula staleyi DSM 6068]